MHYSLQEGKKERNSFPSIHFAGTMLTIFPDRGLFCVVVIALAGGLVGGTALGAGAAEGALSRCLAASIFSPCSIR